MSASGAGATAPMMIGSQQSENNTPLPQGQSLLTDFVRIDNVMNNIFFRKTLTGNGFLL